MDLRVYTSALSHSDHITEWTLRFYTSVQSLMPRSVSDAQLSDHITEGTLRFYTSWPHYRGDPKILRQRSVC